jgi:hypothetical protein
MAASIFLGLAWKSFRFATENSLVSEISHRQQLDPQSGARSFGLICLRNQPVCLKKAVRNPCKRITLRDRNGILCSESPGEPNSEQIVALSTPNQNICGGLH